tara:strand:- start:396 stop:497 length:102 start_codon:yes stop_codon:yes gene_type:complete
MIFNVQEEIIPIVFSESPFETSGIPESSKEDEF